MAIRLGDARKPEHYRYYLPSWKVKDVYYLQFEWRGLEGYISRTSDRFGIYLGRGFKNIPNAHRYWFVLAILGRYLILEFGPQE